MPLQDNAHSQLRDSAVTTGTTSDHPLMEMQTQQASVHNQVLPVHRFSCANAGVMWHNRQQSIAMFKCHTLHKH